MPAGRPWHGRGVNLQSVRHAARVVYGAAIRTPLIRIDVSDIDSAPAELYLKLETLQPIGSFKIRGAFNAISALPRRDIERGVWTVSAGNAAQGVALAARIVGVPCSVLVMDSAPDAKLNAIERLGARIVKASYDECWRTVEEHESDRMEGFFVHPFDDDRFISGNGTIGLEILEDLPDVDAVVASLGGGGLLSGIAAVMREARPDAQVFAAEPETAAPLASSFRAGKAVYFDNWQPSFVDGAGGKSVLDTMWPLLSSLVTASIVVPLDAIARAMALVARRARVVAEGAGAASVAAALTGDAGRGKVVAVVSGGNIDLSRFAQLTGACDVSSSPNE